MVGRCAFKRSALRELISLFRQSCYGERMAVWPQISGAQFSGYILRLLGVMALVLLVASGCQSTSLMPLIPLLMVAGVHWVSWRLYVHNN
jgi:hypothetical protein